MPVLRELEPVKVDGDLGHESTTNMELVLGPLRVTDRKVIKDVQDKALNFVEKHNEILAALEWKEREDGQRWKFHHLCYAGDEPGQVSGQSYWGSSGIGMQCNAMAVKRCFPLD